MFFKHSSNGNVAILIVYVDDIILTSDDEVEMINLKNTLSQEFEIKDLGALSMLICKPMDIPMEHNGKLSDKEESPPVDKGQYRRLVGKLNHLSHIRPDITFPVSVYPTEKDPPVADPLQTIQISGENDHFTYASSLLELNEVWGLERVLQRNKDVFKWAHSNMPGIHLSIASHWLNVLSSSRLVHQKVQRFHPNRQKIIQIEIDKLLAVGFIREVEYPDWLANMVVVPKKRGK
ncbi:hypothetical protein AAG906_029355 [Vitis piasezkii]